MKVTKTQKSILKDLCKRFNVTYRIIKKSDSSYCDLEQERIYILDKYYNIDQLISIALHEICHVLCKREKKFPVYHSTRTTTERDARIIVQTGWRAERYVDKRAKLLMKELFPKRKFSGAYKNNQADRDWLDKHYLDYFREIYRKVLIG